MAEIIALPYGHITAVSWLIVLADQTILIDPTAAPKWMKPDLPRLSLILATHGHIDHIYRADEWRDSHGADLAIHPADSSCLTDTAKNLSILLGRARVYRAAERSLAEGQVLEFDEHHRIEVLHTPGHTAGGCCFLLYEKGRATALFSGDTLFAGSVGRTDLGGDQVILSRSLQRLVSLAETLNLTEHDDLAVYPGHGESTGLCREIRTNPFL
ncbi:MAG: MBL fold metallo-hydrolase [Bacillota bacterium]|nr:MBL fold metallo-hydrolase [Bacillota bacterium]